MRFLVEEVFRFGDGSTVFVGRDADAARALKVPTDARLLVDGASRGTIRLAGERMPGPRNPKARSLYTTDAVPPFGRDAHVELDSTPVGLSPKFWSTVDAAGGSYEAMRPLLERMSRDELFEFYREYEAAREALHDERFYGPGMSDDDVDDIAMWIIGRGQAEYRDVLAHPEKMPRELPSTDGLGYNGLASEIFEDRYHQHLYELLHPAPDDRE